MLQRRPLPDRIQNAPTLFLGLELFYAAFLDLNDEREMGFGEGPIPWRALHEYCLAQGIAGEQREDVFHLVKRMDAAYLKFRSEQREKDQSG